MQQLNLFAESTPVLPVTYYPDFLTLFCHSRQSIIKCDRKN
jgi:hypothetical protein